MTMVSFVVYDAKTGEILRAGLCPDWVLAEQPYIEGEEWKTVAEIPDARSTKVDLETGELVTKEPEAKPEEPPALPDQIKTLEARIAALEKS